MPLSSLVAESAACEHAFKWPVTSSKLVHPKQHRGEGQKILPLGGGGGVKLAWQGGTTGYLLTEGHTVALRAQSCL